MNPTPIGEILRELSKHFGKCVIIEENRQVSSVEPEPKKPEKKEEEPPTYDFNL